MPGNSSSSSTGTQPGYQCTTWGRRRGPRDSSLPSRHTSPPSASAWRSPQTGVRSTQHQPPRRCSGSTCSPPAARTQTTSREPSSPKDPNGAHPAHEKHDPHDPLGPRKTSKNRRQPRKFQDYHLGNIYSATSVLQAQRSGLAPRGGYS